MYPLHDQEEEVMPLQIPTENQSCEGQSNHEERLQTQDEGKAEQQQLEYTNNNQFIEGNLDMNTQLRMKKHDIESEMKAIKFQQTNEKMSSRPMSSLYVDDADEEEEDDEGEQGENNIQEIQEQALTYDEVQESMPVSAEPSEMGENYNTTGEVPPQQQMNQELPLQESRQEPHQQISIEDEIATSCRYAYEGHIDDGGNGCQPVQ